MGKNKGKKKQQPKGEQSAAPAQEESASSRETSQPPDQPADHQKKEKKGQQPGAPSQAGPSQEVSASQGDQLKKGKKGKQPETPSQAPKPQEVIGPQGDQPKKGKKGQQPESLSQGTQPGPPKEVSDQPKKGKKGPPQEQSRQQDTRRGSQQDQSLQQQKGVQKLQQGQDRPPGPARQQQQGPQGQQQPQVWTPQQAQALSGQQAQALTQQQAQALSGQQAQAWAQQQSGRQVGPWQQQPGSVQATQQYGAPQQQAWRQPQQAPPPGWHPDQGQQRAPFPPHQQAWVPSQVGAQDPRSQVIPPGLQAGQVPPSQQAPRGPPPQAAAARGQRQQPQTTPVGAQDRRPQVIPPGLQAGQVPPSQQAPRGPPPQAAVGRGQRQQPQTTPVGAQDPRPQGIPPGLQAGQVPPSQQAPRGPPPQKATGKDQRQQPQATPSQQPSRSSLSPVESATSSLASLKLPRSDGGDAGIVSNVRRKPGTKGRIIKVESNHLQLNLGSLKVAYHYDVNIEPDKPKKFMRPVVAAFVRKHFPRRYPAFDGKKNLYTSSPLTNNLNDFFDDEISLQEEDNREKKFKVEIKFANKVDLTGLHNFLLSPVTPQEALQVVDIVLRMAPVETCFPVGRSFFVKPQQIIDLGQGMEMYHGFYQSAIRGWKPLLNVDVAHKAFPKAINVVDALLELLNTGRNELRRDDLRSLNGLQEETLNSFIKTLRVTYQIPNHPETRKGYRVNGIGQCAQNAIFKHENRDISVVDYFSRVKNYKIRHPLLPTLWVGNSQRPDKILLPLELCYICEGQALNRKMTDLQTSKMIRQAATDTTTRKSKIVQGIQRANYNNNPCVNEFGFSVGNEFQKLDARVLTPPELQYANKTVRVSRGVWRNDLFLSGVTIKNWTFVNACKWAPRPDDYRKMVELFEKSGKECGMEFASRATEPFKNITGRQNYSDIEQYFKSEKGKFDVIFVIVPDSGPQYSYVKKAAEIAVGCLTQCIKTTTVGRKMNPQTAVNILLKVNSKLNGINHTFSRNTKPKILMNPVMIMGADVTHPGPDSRDIPSVAAVTASHDPKAFQYNFCWRLQNPKVEIIEDLTAIVQEHLKFFYQKTKAKPVAIVFFRDGVSEGQFEQVKHAEIRAIRLACKNVQSEGYEPKITFLVVQKRHHTRLFPMNPRDSEDRNMNVPAGTCVDTDITHPFLQDFYLVSHASIQGVAKPTKYCTLWDDNDMDNDQVEELAYYLCHMFSRCNRSVSYPAPTYYAHLAAARAKVYIENDRLNMDRLRQEFDRFQIRDEIRKGLPMFFV